MNLDIFFDHLEREVNGLEPHSVEVLFKRFDEVSSKLCTNTDILKDVDVLKLSEKENSELFEQIVDINELNNMLRNYDSSILKYMKNNNRNSSNSDSFNELKTISNVGRKNSFDNKKFNDNNSNRNDISYTINQIMSRYEPNNNNNNSDINNNCNDSIINLVDESMDDCESENIMKKKISEQGRKKKQYKIEPKRINKKKK